MNIYNHYNTFLDNKYTKIYYNIINNAIQQHRLKNTTQYYESHHILPKSIFPEFAKNKTNLVLLTPKEHFVCHKLLVKMTFGRSKFKMLRAVLSYTKWANKNQLRNYKISSRAYQNLKENYVAALKDLWANDIQYRHKALSSLKKLTKDNKHKTKMSELRKKKWQDSEYLEKMKNRKKSYKKVIINNVEYNSLKEAAMALNITANCVSKRCSSPNFKDWNYGFTNPGSSGIDVLTGWLTDSAALSAFSVWRV